ncbi:MAG: carboxypeptidase-like regulatory domain-containing protein, partial [Ferruginibacter sp.]
MQNDYANNFAYLWQGTKLVHLSENKLHIAGPFNRGNITFFNPGSFDINFNFEAGYQYSLSKQVLRLEKKPLFPRKDLKNTLQAYGAPSLVLGDTILPAPAIYYPPVESPLYFNIKMENLYNQFGNTISGTGALQFTRPVDSVFAYYILEPADAQNRRIILQGNYDFRLRNIQPGLYSLLMITHKRYTVQVDSILIKPGYITCLRTNAIAFTKDNLLLKKIIRENETIEAPKQVIKKEPEKIYTAPDNVIYIPAGGAAVSGTITDKQGGSGIPAALVTLKGYNRGVVADASGYFIFNGLRPGRYTLQIASVGYQPKEVEIKANANEDLQFAISIDVSVNRLEEVIVTGYGTVKKRDITGSMASVNSMDLSFGNQLQGKVAGVNITNAYGRHGDGAKIFIRGMSSKFSNDVLFVVDGIVMDKVPANLDENSILEVSVLKDAAAVAIYGERAANGVIIITTKTKTSREQFKDYALWQPNFFTDKNGHAAIEINYPDNITGWKTFVLAMDKKRRVGKASILTQAYKPMVAELSLPQFLIDGDSVNIIGKSKNYTADKYSVSTSFLVNGNAISSAEKMLLPNDANIETVKISNNNSDTITASYHLQSSTGFNDGEERKIPVFKKGTEEAIGNFWVLQGDTTVSFKTLPQARQLNIFAQNNTLD